MLTDVCQRWSQHRGIYVPADTCIRTSDYEIAEIPDTATAKGFVLNHHYSSSYPSAVRRFGLYYHWDLVGVCIYSVPFQAGVKALLGDIDPTIVTELGRLVLLDWIPGNAESWFVARTQEVLRKTSHYQVVISMSDPVPRQDNSGRTVFRGHIGTVYQALNATYSGRGSARRLKLLPDGSVFSARAESKIRARDMGWRYSVDQLVRAGAPDPGDMDLKIWLRDVLPQVTTSMPHEGNHRYVWWLDKRLQKRASAACLPYPKFIAPT